MGVMKSIKKELKNGKKRLMSAFKSLSNEQIKFLIQLEINKGMITQTCRELSISYYEYSKWRKEKPEFLFCMDANKELKKELVRDKILKIALKDDDEDLLIHLNEKYNKEDLAKLTQQITNDVVQQVNLTVADMYPKNA